MGPLLSIAGAAFFGAFMWREVLLGLPALTGLGTDADRRFLSSYYARVTGTRATRTALALASIVTFGGATPGLVQAAPAGSSVATAALLGLVIATSALSTWPSARLLARLSHARAGAREGRRLVATQLLMLITLGGVTVINVAAAGETELALATAGAAALAGMMWNEVLVDWPARSPGWMATRPGYVEMVHGYYRVLTLTGLRSNMAALTLAIGTALAALGWNAFADPSRLSLVAGATFLTFLLPSSATWRRATEIGRLESADRVPESHTYRVVYFHGAFTVLLLATCALQVAQV